MATIVTVAHTLLHIDLILGRNQRIIAPRIGTIDRLACIAIVQRIGNPQRRLDIGIVAHRVVAHCLARGFGHMRNVQIAIALLNQRHFGPRGLLVVDLGSLGLHKCTLGQFERYGCRALELHLNGCRTRFRLTIRGDIQSHRAVTLTLRVVVIILVVEPRPIVRHTRRPLLGCGGCDHNELTCGIPLDILTDREFGFAVCIGSNGILLATASTDHRRRNRDHHTEYFLEIPHLNIH